MKTKSAVLVQERKPAGSFRVIWNGSNSPSGLYLVRLENSGTTIVKRLLLVK